MTNQTKTSRVQDDYTNANQDKEKLLLRKHLAT
jgi:hypothetical protein